jgi:pimeloyl-ACP methyl ester carboxylesterase
MSVAERTASIVNVHGIDIDVEIRGSGAPILLIPSEEGLEAQLPVIDELAKTQKVVIAFPPGFGRSERPDWMSNPDDLAYVMLDLASQLGLEKPALVGFSFSGWVAAEMAVKNAGAFSKLVLVGAVGVKIGGPYDVDIQDVWLQHPAKVAAFKWADPEKANRDYSGCSDEELSIVARNVESFARFGWEPYMHNPKLKHRLHRVSIPTHLIWGDKDGVVTKDYGCAFAGLIPGASFETVANAGHYPQLEQPEAFAKALTKFLR